jgi:signal peptidase I
VRDGRAFVNGAPVDGDYLRLLDDDPRLRNFGPVTVPLDSYFMMGDNRDDSLDSRAWGFANRSLIRGRAFLIWFSYREQKNDHLNTGINRIISMVRKVLHPQGVRFQRIFSRIH